jgi:NADH-quinone oxidoreductase subunit L
MTVPLIVLAVLAAIGGFVGIPEVFVKGGDKVDPISFYCYCNKS